MEDQNLNVLQLFVRLLDGKTASLTFASQQAYGHQIKQRIWDLTKVPVRAQRLICGGYQIDDSNAVSQPDVTVNLVLSLRGGKGGFGSLLRGAATKAGQKKTNNFDACRDMSGRRLRHVNAEKRLEEWKAGEEERKLEKLAEEFLKKQAKKGKQGVGNGEVKKYVEKYREESAKCVEAVDLAVREALKNGKRKAEKGCEDAKRLKIRMGMRMMGDTDSEDSSDDEEKEDSEKSVVLNTASLLVSKKDAEGSSGLVTGHNGESSGGASCESGSEEEKESVIGHQTLECGGFISVEGNMPEEENGCGKPEIDQGKKDTIGFESGNQQKGVPQLSNTPSSEKDPVVNEEADAANAKSNEPERPFNFDDYNSAADLEALGMDRLKSELQARGLKCGGTLQERAGRLFLLKSTPLDKIPKKLLARK